VMQSTSRRAVESQIVPDLPGFETGPRFQAAFSILREALNYAKQLQRPVWDFAVEIQVLRAAGLTNSDLRLLICRGLVEHAAEMTYPCQEGRVFRRTGALTFTRQTCFVLVEKNPVAANQEPRTFSLSARPSPPALMKTDSAPIPCWDKERQQLRLGELIVKQFKVPAPNQEIILASFQEEAWPPRIDDPLPPRPDQDTKRRLHDTITTLNRHQKHRLIRFSGDGSGEGVRWDALFQSPTTNGAS
jgi:hypothetical protein